MRENKEKSFGLPRVERMHGIENRCALSGESLARSEKLATGRRVGVGVKLRIGTVNVRPYALSSKEY